MASTFPDFDKIMEEAFEAARAASNVYFKEKLKGEDQYACGFAWVEITGIRSNSKLGKELIGKYGFKKSYTKSGTLTVWNPGGLTVQNIDCKEEGAIAFANVLKARTDIRCYPCARLD